MQTWNGQYAEDKIPLADSGDLEWLAEGRHLLDRVRQAMNPGYTVVASEPWWTPDST